MWVTGGGGGGSELEIRALRFDLSKLVHGNLPAAAGYLVGAKDHLESLRAAARVGRYRWRRRIPEGRDGRLRAAARAAEGMYCAQIVPDRSPTLRSPLDMRLGCVHW